MTKLENYMITNKLSANDVAKKLKCTRQAVQSKMKTALEKHEITLRYAKALGCPMEEIRGFVGDD